VKVSPGDMVTYVGDLLCYKNRNFKVLSTNADTGWVVCPEQGGFNSVFQFREDEVLCAGEKECFEVPATTSGPKCECGVGKVGGIHSNWCAMSGGKP
jgi:hypothetical protein